MTSTSKTQKTIAPVVEETTEVVDDTNYVAQSQKLQPADLVGELMSVKEAAQQLGLSLSSVSHHAKVGHLKAVTVGSASILLRWSVQEFEQSRMADQALTAEEKELRLKLKVLKDKRNGQSK